VRRAAIALCVGALGVALGCLVARDGLDEWSGARVRALVALGALGWALYLRARRREGRPVPLPVAQGMGGAVALCAAAAWFNFGAMGAIGGVHRHDVFHYYVGSKYHRELGYGLIYRCTALAEAEAGSEALVRQRMFRDLATDHLLPASDALREPARCHDRFTPARWRSFRDDVVNLHRGLNEPAWRQSQIDHGYNPTPAWTVTSGLLSRVVPSSDSGLRCLAALDTLLIALSALLLARAFGWRTAALALVLWGTQEPGKFTWVAFSMLRFDWFFLLVVALVALRRGRPGLAGAAVGWAAAMRGFPALGVAGVLLAGVASPALRARFAVDRRRFALGFAATVVALVALSSALVGPASWIEWTAHIRRHAAVASSNKAGLGIVVSFDLERRVERVQARSVGAPTDVWMQRWSDGVRASRDARRLPLRALQLAGGLLLLAALARARRPWIGLTLAVLFAPIATELSGYYLMLFVLAAVLAAARGALERWLLGFSAAVQVLMVMPAVGWFYDDRYLAISLAYVAAPVGLMIVFARRRSPLARVTPTVPPAL
jgi:hypothetical protein